MKYSEKKAAQVAAFFLHQGHGSLPILKLMKLMYLSERESYTKYGEPLTGDRLCSMDHGPVMSITLNHINDFIESEEDGWDSWISDRENHQVALTIDEDPTEKLTQLSDADIEILNYIWDEYGHLDKYELRDLSHELCTEWEDPEGSSQTIPYSRVLKCVGHNAEVAREFEQRIKENVVIDSMFELVTSENEVTPEVTAA
ncbi:MAG: SocA family protein [Proteobacteria bacterium]|nr:SocA family protein [Pseudomonadota bacterium]